MTPISGLSLTPPSPPALPVQSATNSGAGPSFRNVLLEALDQVNTMQSQANEAVEQLVTGGDVNPAEVLTSLQKADLSFKLMLQIRNKLVQAYQEVNNIRI